ncbi:MAG: gamma-glutamyltransferase, partial [Algiphilus sp.]
AVATSHPLATEVAIKVLADGGNAFDAAVAATAALAVVEPHESGLGGGGFFLVHRAADGAEFVVDARETAPGAATGDMYLDARGEPVAHFSQKGPLASAIPGVPAALDHLNRHFGTRALRENLAPAIGLAQDGFPVSTALSTHIRKDARRLSTAARAVYLPAGRVPAPGERLVQMDLGRTLQALAARGSDGFYRGPVAQQLRAGVFKDGGIWTLDDLRAYRIEQRPAAHIHYQGHRISTAPLPAAGGVTMAQILTMLEASQWPPRDETAARHMLIEAMRLSYRDLASHLADPAFVDVPTDRLTARSYLVEQANTIGPRARASASLDIATVTQRAERGPNTTHFSIIDAAGNRVAATLSLNQAFGSGYMPPGTGVLLNNQMADFEDAPLMRTATGVLQTKANHIQPHKRPLSTMSPTFVTGPHGVLITGTPGGSRAITMNVLAVLLHINGLDVEDIVGAPRFHHQFLPDEVHFEREALTP